MQPPENIAYVPSLDGLRTIAVGMVIAFHLSVPRMGLGFAGVDVFFVLSGYLITAGLLRDTIKHGRPQFAKFWQRRFRRLLPAATLILLLVLIYATFFMPLFRKAAASWDIFWTVLYLGNWRFMGANSYFASDGTPSLLLHMWSLAVEEQFYFFWPVLIGLIAYLAAKFGGRRSRVVAIIGVVCALLIVISAVLLMMLYDPAAPDRAYMGTDTKAFEPLMGALLAIAMTNAAVRTFFFRHHRIIAAVGIVAAVAVLPFLAGPSAFYFHGGAVILSIGVTLLIGALVVSPPTMLSGFLAWGPMAYLGQISYGLYLWHWPWSVWLDVAHQEEFRMLRAPVALALTLICAVLSYHFVEEPIRRGRLTKWLTFPRTMISVAVIMVIVMAWAAALRGVPAPRPPAATPVSPGASPVAQTNDELVVVVGDSVPFRLMESLDQVATDNDFVIDNASRGGCPPLAIELQEYLKPDHEGSGDCRMVADIQAEKIEQDRPGTVFWWSRYEVHQRWLDGRIVGPDEESFWEALEEDLATSVDRLTAQGATLVIAQTERPGTGMLSRCTEEDCHPLLDLMTHHDEYRRRWNQLVVDLAATDERVKTFRMDPVLCKDPEPEAPLPPALCDDSRPDGKLLRPDGSHILVDPFGYETAEAVLAEVLTAANG